MSSKFLTGALLQLKEGVSNTRPARGSKYGPRTLEKMSDAAPSQFEFETPAIKYSTSLSPIATCGDKLYKCGDKQVFTNELLLLKYAVDQPIFAV